MDKLLHTPNSLIVPRNSLGFVKFIDAAHFFLGQLEVNGSNSLVHTPVLAHSHAPCQSDNCHRDFPSLLLSTRGF